MDLLLVGGIAPRIQSFLFRDNADDLQAVAELITDMRLEERCTGIGTPFAAFVHQGSCDGANAECNNLYDLRPTSEEVAKIPPLLVDYSLKHFGKNTIFDVFGQPEKDLYEQLKSDTGTKSSASDSPVFYVDSDFNIYPNFSEPSPYWRLGNLKNDGAETVAGNYLNNRSVAQHARMTVPLGDMVRGCGSADSVRLFDRSDYEAYILSRYLEGVNL